MRKWLPAVFIAIDLAFVAAVYHQLPDRIVTHWGLGGPDGWSSRSIAVWVLPASALGAWMLLRFLPLIDPHHANYAAFRPQYDLVVAGVVLLMVAVHVAVLGSALGWPVRVDAVISVAVGGLLVLVGTVLPRARPTWFFGIRTPWTLSNDVVWERTQRVGGKLAIVAGLLVMTTGFLTESLVVYAVIGAAIACVLAMVVYSYFAWREVTGG